MLSLGIDEYVYVYAYDAYDTCNRPPQPRKETDKFRAAGNVQSAITKNWIPQFEQAICRLEPYRESLLSEPGVDMES